MIYNKEIEEDLIVMFGEEVLTWSKPLIRNKLEDRVTEYKDEVLKNPKHTTRLLLEEQ